MKLQISVNIRKIFFMIEIMPLLILTNINGY